jgi:hypothetical protein
MKYLFNTSVLVAAMMSGHSYIQDIFAERCQKIMEDSSGIGWGFSDAMCGIYEEAFEGEEE